MTMPRSTPMGMVAMVMTFMVMTPMVAVVVMMMMMFCLWRFLLCFLLRGPVTCLYVIRVLQLTVSTHSGAVGVSDGFLHVRLAQDRIRQRQVMCETSTSVIDLDVVLLSIGYAPNVRIFRVLLVQVNVI